MEENFDIKEIHDIQLQGDAEPKPVVKPSHDEAAHHAPTNDGAMKKSPVMRTVANTLSGVFLPLLVPTYGYAMALWISYLSLVPEKTRFITSIIVFLITAVIPLGTIIFLMRRGKVSDAALSKPSERGIPYAVTILCYGLATWYLSSGPEWLYMFFAGAGVAALIDALINIKWKISAHTTSMGGLCALTFYIGVHHYAMVDILPWIIGVVLLSGAVGSARIYLKRHTPAQVYAGWLVGLVVSYVFMCF